MPSQRLRSAVDRVPERLRLPLAVYAVTQLGFLFWWLALYPGLLSFDSVAYVHQVTTSNWSTNHSVAYNVFVWLSLQITGGLGLLSLVQTVVFAAGIAYTVAGLRLLAPAAGRALAVAAIALPCLPSIGLFVTYISKDNAFVICQIFLLGTLARIVVARRTLKHPFWTDKRMRLLLGTMAVEFVGLALFRQNGLLVVLVAAAVVALALAGVRVAVLLAGVAAAGLSLLLNLAVFPAMGVKEARSDLLFGPAYADIAVVLHDQPNSVTQADREVLARVAPVQVWAESANCYDADDTTRRLNLNTAAANSDDLFAVWQRLVKRAPDEVIDARLCRGSIAWVPLGSSTVETQMLAVNRPAQLERWRPRAGEGNPYQAAIKQDPVVGPALTLARFLQRATTSKYLSSFFWRGAFWCYVAYLAVLLFMRRAGDRGLLALISVALANQLVVLVNNPAQLARYMMGPIFIGILLLPLLFGSRSTVRHPAPAFNATLSVGNGRPPGAEPVPAEPPDKAGPDLASGRRGDQLPAAPRPG